MEVKILPVRKSPSPHTYDAASPPSTSPQSSEGHGAKQKRASRPKTRSGCVTCKIRRVKCDEAKPKCKRCTSTGRHCDGYAVKPRKKRASPKLDDDRVSDIILRPHSSPRRVKEVSLAESRSLEFYHYKTAPALSSHFDSDFWLRIVFQMSHVEPAVKHAMVALGAFHEQREQNLKTASDLPVIVKAVSGTNGSHTGHDYGLEEEFALTQYGKALVLLSSRLTAESPLEVTLMTCIMFVCVEFLRGDGHQAIAHFRSGMNIAISSLATDGSSTVRTDTIRRIRKIVLPFLNRIELLSSLRGDQASWSYPIDLLEAVPEKFENIKQARDSLIHVANLTVRFIKSVGPRRYEHNILADDLARRAALSRQLGVWAETLDKMLSTKHFTPTEWDAANTMRMHQVVASIWLETCIYRAECSTDGSLPDYELAVSLAESVQERAQARDDIQDSTFLFDMEMVSPLFWITNTCRHPLLRRRALALLKRTRRREGLWDSNRSAAAAERVVHHEELHLTILDGSELPPEKDRIHNVDIEAPPGTNATTFVVAFKSLPDGFQGNWRIWKEEITLP